MSAIAAVDDTSVARNSDTRETPARRIGVLLDSTTQERWALEMLRAALGVRGTRLVAIAVASGRPEPASIAARVHRLLGRVDEGLRCRGEDLLARVDVGAEFPAVPRVEVALVGGVDAWSLDATGAAELRRLGADVWLCLCAGTPRRPLPRIAGYGVWGLEIGVNVAAGSHWAGAAEVAMGSPVTIARVVDYCEPRDVSLYQGVGATVNNSPARNRLAALRRARSFFGRSLSAVPADWVRRLSERPPTGYPVRPAPTLGGIAQLGWRLAAKVAANRWLALGWRRQWQLAYAFCDDAAVDVGRLRYLVPPKDRFWADPFALEHAGRHFIFFEEYLYRTAKGRIVAVEVNERDSAPREPEVVLERPYHLSYPFVFHWRGELYMVPETADNDTVELYRCEEFPARWCLERVLLTNVRAYDATLCEHGDRWWMFASVAPPGTDGNDELHLYSSATPLGPWKAHRRNPLLVDARRARCAGPLFLRDGALCRPSQDCSIAYGHSITLNRVNRLDDHDYDETPAGRIEPGWRRDVRRVHTFGASGRLKVVDLLVHRRR